MTTLEEAACANNLGLVKSLFELGQIWDGRTCVYAARNKNMEMLKYANEHGCPLLSFMLCEAARVGNIEAIKYGLNHGMTCNEHVSWWASRYKQEHVVNWLKKANYPIHSECEAMRAERISNTFFNK